MRKRRRTMSAHLRRQLAERLARQFAKTPLFRNAHHVAIYLTMDAEMDLAPLTEALSRHNKKLYLPVLSQTRSAAMRFARYRPGQSLVNNRFGIAEPHPPSFRPAQQLDVVLTPLVAFDDAGNRMGMGGGFYDRTFAYRLDPTCANKPLLIGVGYRCQRVAKLATEAWDVPLDGVLTERGLRRFSPHRNRTKD